MAGVQSKYNGCISTDTINVNFIDQPEINIEQTPVTCEQPSTVLFAAIDDSFNVLWNTGATESTIEIQDTGLYWVTASVDDCSDTDTIHVNIVSENCEKELEVKAFNIFTPNGDGINDTFTIDINKTFIYSHLTIYNRWGIEVYKTTTSLSWDGKLPSQQLAAAGTYFWAFTFEDNFGKNYRHNGFVMLQ